MTSSQPFSAGETSENVTDASAGEIITTSVLVSNLHCASCTYTINKALSALSPPPLSISCNILIHNVIVVHPPQLSASEILRALLELEFEVDSFTCSGRSFSFSGSGYGSIVNFGALGFNGGRPRSWLDEAGERLYSAFESGRKRKRHLETCEQCKEEHGRDSVTSLPIRYNKSRYQGFGEGRSGSASTSSQTLLHSSVKEEEEGKGSGPFGRPPPLATSSLTYGPNAQLRRLEKVHMADDGTVDELPLGRAVTSDTSAEQLSLEKVFEKADSTGPSTQLYESLFSIEGMTCSSCTGRVNETIEALPFVRSVEVALISNSATVTFEGQKEDAQKIADEVEDIGYGCTLESVKGLGMTETVNATERSLAIQIEGMYCEHCPRKVISTLEAFLPRLRVDKAPTLTEPIVKISYTPSAPDFTIRQIIASIKEIDSSFEPSIYHPPSIEERSRRMLALEQRRLYVRLVCCIIIAIPTFVLGVVYMSLVPSHNRIRIYLGEYILAGKVTRMDWALFFLATPVQFFIADVFHKRAFKDIKGLWRKGSKTPILRRFYRFGSMNLLVSLGVSIAYFASIALLGIAATASQHVQGQSATYFDSTVFLTMFLLMGRCLEMYSKSKTADAVGMLGKLRPAEALLVDQIPEQGENSSQSLDEKDVFSEVPKVSVRKIPVDMLEAGDIIVIQHGGSPPTDGKVVNGDSKFDESSLTGEARPIEKHKGDTVYAGTINKGKIVHVQVDAVCGESMLDQIVKVVREGQTRRAPIERIADGVTAYFVPVVTLIAILTWVIWLALGQSGVLPSRWLDTYQGGWPVWSLGFAIAVFVVACPCGIGLAAPTALFVGSGLAAKHGILAKGGGEAFQEASSLDCVVFDKTGTLTLGSEPNITDEKLFVTEPEEVKLVYAVASALEENSSHPLAKATVNYCRSKERCIVTIDEVEEVPGRGLYGTLTYGKKTHHVIIGNESFMRENGVVSLDGSARATLHTWKTSGKSVILLAIRRPSSLGFVLFAAFAAMDPLRPEAKNVISSLQKDGIAVYMITGDNSTTAFAVANMVGIPTDNVIAGVLPTEKAEKIQQLQKTGSRKRRNYFSSHPSNPAGHADEAKKDRAVVAMVGDGINDAPALTSADVGIAIGSGSDIAINSAKFILLNSNLVSLLTLISLSRRVIQRVKFNFFWACVYNLIALPVAAGALYAVHDKRIRLDPVWASLAMACSSVSVVCSSLLLRSKVPGIGYRPPKMEVVQKKEEERRREAEEKV